MVAKAWRRFSILAVGLMVLGAACGSSKGTVLFSPGDDSADSGTGIAEDSSTSSSTDALTDAPAYDFRQDVALNLSGSSSCQAGVYNGMFMCTYQPLNSNSDAGVEAGAGGLINVQVSGTVSLTLSQMTSGGESFLTVSMGNVSGTAQQGKIDFSATIQGNLTCSTGKFSGEWINGKWMSTTPGLFGPAMGTFMISSTADYDSSNRAFVNGLMGGGCIGVWSATYAGPAGTAGGPG